MKSLMFILLLVPLNSFGMYWRKGGKKQIQEQPKIARTASQERIATEKLREYIKYFFCIPRERDNIFNIIENYVDQGADPNVTDHEGTPLLHLIIWEFNNSYIYKKTFSGVFQKRMIIKLLDHGADIDAVDEYNRTALLLAVHHNLPYVVEVLLERGADITIKYNCSINGKQMTCLDVAKQRPVSKVRKIVEPYFEKQKLP